MLPACRTIGGVTVKYATWDSKVLQKDDEGAFFIDYPYASYYYYETDLVDEKPIEAVTLLVTVNKNRKGDVNGDGVTDVYDLQRCMSTAAASPPSRRTAPSWRTRD